MSSNSAEKSMEDEFKDMKMDDPEDEFFSKGKTQVAGKQHLYAKMKSRLFGSSETSKITAKAQDDANSLAQRVLACRSPIASALGGIKIQVQM